METAGNFSLKIGNDIIQQSESISNLGVFWDKELKGTTHFNKLTSSLCYNIRNIAWIRHLIDRDTTKMLMQALLLSKLNYCNSTFIRCTQYNLSKLQRIQNMPAMDHNCRILCLCNLHWLKVAERIDFKVAIFMLKCLRGTAHPYLQELITTKHGHTGLRSSTNDLLPITRYRTALVHKGSFSSGGPVLWNNLPITIQTTENIDIFKTKL